MDSLVAWNIFEGQFAKGKCKESAANWVRFHNISRNWNLLHHKSINMHHERRWTKLLSIWIQDSKKIATRLLAASTSSVK
jgi:hypothetical protein